MPKRILLDTNVLIRFLTGEPLPLAKKAKALIAAADQGEVELLVLPMIVAETVYTLESYYKLERKLVSNQMLVFLQSKGIVLEDKCVLDALHRHVEANVHFMDAYLAACSAETGFPVVSFDRDFKKFNDIEWIEPKMR